MTWSAVGSPSFNAANSGTISVAVSPTSTSNIFLLVIAEGAGTGSPTGGGVTTWTLLDNRATSSGFRFRIFAGQISSTGSSTISVPTAAASTGVWVIELSGGVVPLVDVDGVASYTSTLSGNYPSLTPGFANEIYLGVGAFTEIPSSTSPGGSSTGFTYYNNRGMFGSLSFWMQIVLQLNVNGPTAYSPAWTSAGGTGLPQDVFDCVLHAPPKSKIVMLL